MKLLIAIIVFGGSTVRVMALRGAGYPTTPPLVALMYHSVKRHERDRFAQQMDRLLRVGQPVYADFDAAKNDGVRRVAVTFDDAYHSVFENAFPVLRERSIPATFFVPTQFIGRAPGWITDDRHRDADERVLTADELREMHRGGALIGSHSVTHRQLARLSQAEVLAELTGSRDALTEILGARVHVFALPYGAGNAEVVRLATSAGYTRVFLNLPTRVGSRPAHVVGRIEVNPGDWRLEYYLKIRGAYQWLHVAVAAKRRVVSALRTAFPRSFGARRSNRAVGATFPLS